jgi:6-phosphogluconolactonase
MNIHILESVDALAHSVADRIEAAVAKTPNLSVGLAGGSTPRIVHHTVAQRPIDWTHVTTWMTDERWVPPTDEHSNQRMVTETLVLGTGVRFIGPDTTLSSPHDAAEAFDRLLREEVIGEGRRSIAMLGLGSDGHTASLFPNTDALKITDRLYTENWVPTLKKWRLTATYPMFATVDTVYFLVAGSDKAEVVARIAAGESCPASEVMARSDVEWLLDPQAASML